MIDDLGVSASNPATPDAVRDNQGQHGVLNRVAVVNPAVDFGGADIPVERFIVRIGGRRSGQQDTILDPELIPGADRERVVDHPRSQRIPDEIDGKSFEDRLARQPLLKRPAQLFGIASGARVQGRFSDLTHQGRHFKIGARQERRFFSSFSRLSILGNGESRLPPVKYSPEKQVHFSARSGS